VRRTSQERAFWEGVAGALPKSNCSVGSTGLSQLAQTIRRPRLVLVDTAKSWARVFGPAKEAVKR
jgi:hypothetical protein